MLNISSDCVEVLARNQTAPGVYKLQADGSPLVFSAYCEDGWTFIQRHFDNSENFEQFVLPFYGLTI